MHDGKPAGEICVVSLSCLIRPSARRLFVGRRNVHGDSGESGEASPDSESTREPLKLASTMSAAKRPARNSPPARPRVAAMPRVGFGSAWRISRHTHVTMTSKAGGPVTSAKARLPPITSVGASVVSWVVPWAEISVMRPRHRVPVTCPPSSTLRSTGPLEEKYVSRSVPSSAMRTALLSLFLAFVR